MVLEPLPQEQRFFTALRSGDWPTPDRDWSLEEVGLSAADLAELFETQLMSRHLDLHARRLQARGEAFYTIGSAGHEGNAAIARAFRATDPAFLHYRDAAFLIQRSRGVPGQTPLWDLLLSFAASADDPISGGRHKVLGSKSLHVPPQTSTIASHLPKAVGAAYSFGLWRRLGGVGEWPADGVAICSFGDASFNHSTAQGALNAAGWAAYQGAPLPLVMVCEDNGIGISTPTPNGWIEASMRSRPGFHYLACDGLDLLDTWRAAREAERIARLRKQPVFLHMRCVRLYGHAGSDAQQAYLSPTRIKSDEARDPLLVTAGLLERHGVLGRDAIAALYRSVAERVAHVAEEAICRPKLETAAQVMASIVPPPRAGRERPWQGEVEPTPAPMAKLLNQALARLMESHPHLVMAGEDIGRKGGVYGVTQRLQAQFGPHRVIDTLLDEQSILGLGIGLGQNGLVPILEIQFLAYLHNAEDQLRGEAATLSFFSNGQYTNPMVVRIAGLGYQKGFGGHFHNDNAIAVLRDIPGLLVACPSNAADAVGLLQEAVRLADEEQRVVVVIEPIALYHTRDLHEEGDQQWCFADPGPGHRLVQGVLGQWGEGSELAIVTYGNGVYLSRQAAARLEAQGVRLRIVDLRWLTAIDHDAVYRHVAECDQVLVVDECRRSGSLSEELITALVERGMSSGRLHRLTAEDSFIPLGRAATVTLPSVAAIVEQALRLAAPGAKDGAMTKTPGKATAGSDNP
ncbi:dehydrogenase E1 component subunit alpha/beta [Billgrantia aerodenitrificans]|jgi:2-oxoisovalerate dehydrogenase E1 component|uniref:3-methyl-2-oxobutanoate dehydrogenase (2-methylpropanoyl-transferring) n=1 Tax=Billgrantia aerodenitrificans TaxID=2733483 RepID=A0ABS9AU58_9GAMM|nr:alpha-ketoacid dehydrogenase subunit alpha/beta [Halomonas aerodenitrificans]MCE8025173.1 MFS transporter [Halomonas aerodenitrificans]